MRWLLLLYFFAFFTSPLFAQSTSPEGKKSPTPEERLKSLKTIATPLASAISEMEKLQAELNLAKSDDAKQEVHLRIEAERARVLQLRENFRDILGGSEAAEYDETSIASKGIQEQISELIQPALSEIRDATSGPRELDALRKSLEISSERKRKADIVIKRIDELIGSIKDKLLISELKSARRIWASRQAQATSEIAVNTVQIDDRTRIQRSLWETLSTGFSKFFKSRGMNLLLALLAGLTGYIATRKTYLLLRKISPIHKGDSGNFSSRFSDILSIAIAILMGLLGIILVFYFRGDWLLLTLVVIFLIGVAWAGKTAIPPYLEQIRMVLNLGCVREGERVIFNGLPWKVSKLGFFTVFTNPSLHGGHLRVPICDVMDMISRPIADKEVWFPSETDDWIILSDETYGKTIVQTPEQVVVLRLGGSMKTYPTADFLALAPENLSHGFRISTTFGIDYAYQAESTTIIPEIFESALTTELTKEYGREAIRSVKVEFTSASASSLDYEVLADFDGSEASKFNRIKRSIQAICVNTCNENKWSIPFTQITVHQAEKS